MRADIESLLVAQREKQEQSFTVKPVSLTLNRRQFLKATAVGSCGLMVGISLNASANASSAKQAAEFNPNAFIHLQKDPKRESEECFRCMPTIEVKYQK